MEFYILKGVVVVGNKDVFDFNKGIFFKIRLYIRFFFLINFYKMNEFGKVIVYN